MCRDFNGNSQGRPGAARAAAPLVEKILALRTGGGRVIAALDGRCASGKTTLAGALARDFGWSVVHVDHFFLRPEQRTLERYAQPGGNVDHERLLEEVLLPLRRGDAPVYRPFDCRAMRLGEPIPFEPAPVVLVEGSYSCHPALWDCYDVRAFLTIDPVWQMRRLAAREGEERARTFQEKWIPLEERYFSAFEVERRCDFRLEL